MGTDHFVKALRKHPELAHQLLRVSMKAALRLTDAVMEAGGIPVMVDPVASCSVISPGQYEEFAAPYTKPVLEHISAAGLPAILHICGRSDLIWTQMADTGAAVLSLDKVDLAEAKRAVGDRVCLLGNVSPTEALLYGNPASVEEATLECLRQAADNPRGYIVGSGCEVPLMTPPENVDAMIETVRRWGPPSGA
jgi:uroporphyrinogen decarboxylase